MSLINDALKRARVEARRQEEEGRRGYHAVPAHSRRPDRQRLLLIAGWTTAVVALGAVLWLWSAPLGEAPAQAVSPPTPASGQEGTRPASGHPASDRGAPPAERRHATVAGDVDRDGRQQPGEPSAPASAATAPTAAPHESATGDSGTATPSPAAPPPSDATPASSPSAATGPAAPRSSDARLEAGRTYLRSVRAADGSTAELGGIAYSTTRPIAVINGSVVSNGDLIAGFTVVSIEPERVELEADGVRFFLALR